MKNKPVILHVYNRPELMPQQKKAWEDWRDIVRANDPTRRGFLPMEKMMEMASCRLQ